MNDKDILIKNIARLHTTALGVTRIKRNLSLEAENAVEWCKSRILLPSATVTRSGKNYYVKADDCVITVNAGSLTIITAYNGD